MKKRNVTFLISALLVLGCASLARAASWKGLEPFVSKRADVERALGRPTSEGINGTLNFAVMGGTVSVSFVDAKFVRTKKLRSDIEGTVLQIILQHENSSDTPESMNLTKNRSFTRDEEKQAIIYRNLKEGVVYTFVNGKLKTTRYTFSEGQIGRARH
jgi:hypothetical protein